MKFTLLLATVSALTITQSAPDSVNDPVHPYSVKVNVAHDAIMAKDQKDKNARNKLIDTQGKGDAWRKVWNPDA